MPAYIIADVKVRDTEQDKAYVALSPAAVAAAGGKFIVRGGRTEVLEGSWVPSRVVVIEFDTFDDAKAFYDSVQYRDARDKRAGATDFFNMILVEGAA